MATVDRSNTICDPRQDGSGHPLEALPFFRRIRPFPGRSIVLTLILNATFAAVFSLFWLLFDAHVSVLRVVVVNLVVANCIGFFMHGGFVLGRILLGGWLPGASFAARSFYYSVVSVIGVFAGYALGAALLNWPQLWSSVFSPQGATSILLISVIISATLGAIFLRASGRQRQRPISSVNGRTSKPPRNRFGSRSFSCSKRRSSRIFCTTPWPT